MPGTRAQRREQIRDELLELIETMLDAGEPFSDLSVERLSGAAGMSRTRFYLYFEDKNDLISAWYTQIAADLATTGAGWWDADPPTSREELARHVEDMLRTYRPHATLMAAVEEVAAADPGVRAHLEAAHAADTAALRDHIGRAQAAGTTRLDLDADMVARWLTTLTWRGRRHLLRGADDAEITRLAQAHAALVWNVLYA